RMYYALSIFFLPLFLRLPALAFITSSPPHLPLTKTVFSSAMDHRDLCHVGEGARTGLASVVTGFLFLLTTFLAPLVAIIPYEAATPALVIVGFLMMTQIKLIDWEDYGIAIPAFLTIILMPFTYNISVGIGAGFVSYVVIRYLQGRRKDVHPLLLLTAGLFMIYFLNNPINAWVA
ncbi:MAG: hypothetical protein RIR72_630, partial [Actinomycetota bacterium]